MAKDFHQDRQLVRPRVVSWMDDHILDLTSLLVLSQPGHDVMVNMSSKNTSHIVFVARGEQHLLVDLATNINTRWLDPW